MVLCPERVVLHPLVLLSVVDHYNRVAKGTRNRVVGVLLGNARRGVVDVANSFAVPFEEDKKNPSIWFLDHSYLENIFAMFRKVNAKEKIVGWYSTGPRIREADLEINELMSRFCDDPVLVICEVQPKSLGLPITSYFSKEEVKEGGMEKNKKVFVNIPTEVGQTPAEEVGVEHLLRDVKDASISTLTTEIDGKLQGKAETGYQSLTQYVLVSESLGDIKEYMEFVLNGSIPPNHEIMNNLQVIFSLLPNMNVDTLARALSVKANDMMLGMYTSSMIRCVIALHNLIDNKEIRYARRTEANKKEIEVDTLPIVADEGTSE